MIMACWTEWDPLEEVIVGDCFKYEDLGWKLPNSTASKFKLILEETKEDLDNLSEYLSKMGVKVHRPIPKINQQNIKIAGFDIKQATAPIVPRDQYLVYGETVYQTYTSMPDRYLDSLSYYEIFLELFKQGHNWISQPLPELINFENNDWHLYGEDFYKTKYADKLLWHTACMFKYGDTLISNTSPGSALGLEWMRRNSAHKIITQDRFGHMDHGFFSVNDSIIICDTKDWVPSVLADKNIYAVSILLGERRDFDKYIEQKTNNKEVISDKWMDYWLDEWKGYFQDVCFNFNPLVVDSNNIIFSTPQPKVFKLLDSLGINSHVCPLRHGPFWEAGIHCATLDIKRKGTCRKIIN